MTYRLRLMCGGGKMSCRGVLRPHGADVRSRFGYFILRTLSLSHVWSLHCMLHLNYFHFRIRGGSGPDPQGHGLVIRKHWIYNTHQTLVSFLLFSSDRQAHIHVAASLLSYCSFHPCLPKLPKPTQWRTQSSLIPRRCMITPSNYGRNRKKQKKRAYRGRRKEPRSLRRIHHLLSRPVSHDDG